MANNIYTSMFIFVLYIKYNIDLAQVGRKYSQQTDLSEHCKRRVMPSVFLGNQVMEANSYVMQFSQLEVPYSCFISIRAESGYNIILVIELQSEYSLFKACSENRDQLIVYELGETFGGYWGPHPDVMMTPQTRNYTQYYTLKATPPVLTKRTLKSEDVTQKVPQKTFPDLTDKEPDYITMEVPLVNVSGNLQLVGPLPDTYNAEEMFDFIFDVTPRNGVEYDTSIMPLVQFSIKPQKIDGFYDGTPRYELDYDIRGLTPDLRSTFNTYNKGTTSKKRKWLNNRRHHFGKKNNARYSVKDTIYNYQKYFTRWSSLTSYATIKNTVIPTLESKYSTVSWKYIDDIIKHFNITSTRNTEAENATIQNLLHDISDMDHNSSVYLLPNISAYYNKNYIKNRGYAKKIFNPKPFTKIEMRPILTSSNLYNIFENSNRLAHTKISDSSNISVDLKNLNTETFESTVVITKSSFDDNQSTIGEQIITNEGLKNDTSLIEKININKTMKIHTVPINLINTSTLTTLPRFETGTMVDHESWENIVQAAPVMAVVLNKTELYSNRTNITNSERQETVKTKERKKRHLQALLIENSRPRNLTTKRTSIETAQTIGISDLHDLARLVELQDDEIEGRVALRYLRNYLGSALYNICDISETKTQHTYLFNASRIVIALNNFTLDSMIVVATPAQSVLNSMARCPPGSLECQAVGSRVCIDSTNSCDGIPNCGSYDIYDEDRLLCGTSKDLQFNIYLATLTFLAVCLTMLYIVYYWLKRCIPGVSEAFFIYTDASENTLFLDTVMRSPTDVDDVSCKLVYSGHFFDDDLYQNNEGSVDGNAFAKFLRKCCGLLLFNKKPKDKLSEDIIEKHDSKPTQLSEMLTFTEFELHKYKPTTSKNQEIQTGESIEHIKNKEMQRELRFDKVPLQKCKSNTHEADYQSELSLIKFAKETKSSSLQSVTFNVDKADIIMKRRHALIADDEKEIRSTVYDRTHEIPSKFKDIPKTREIYSEKPKTKVETKRLRFEDEPTLIPSIENEEDDIIDNATVRRSVPLGVGHKNKQDLNTINETEEAGSTSKDFMRFWGTKGKKGKKNEKNLSKR